MDRQTPLYRVRELSWINNTLAKEGAEIPYDGIPGSALEPINDAARAMVGKHGMRVTPAIPLMPEPSAPPAVDWKEMAVAAGWVPATMANPEASAQAPQPDPKKPATTEQAKTGTSAADKLNASQATGQASGKQATDPGI